MKYAVLFPGQGSQSVGMLAALAAAHPVIEQTFTEASGVLGWDVGKLIRSGPEAELNRTERTQPALLAAGIAVWRVWQQHHAPAPVAFAGHSLGEYSALVAAGSLPFADALKIVELRGQLMQEAAPAGSGMAAVIGLDDAGVEKLCATYAGTHSTEMLEPANYNAPGQVVLAGTTAALKWLDSHGKEHGARLVVRLPVSVPSHCSLMKMAALKLSGRLTQINFHSPVIPVLHNLDAGQHTQAVALRGALREQLYKPVRWVKTIQALAAQGVTLFLECGPGTVLSGLNKRIGKLSSIALEETAALQEAVHQVKGQGA